MLLFYIGIYTFCLAIVWWFFIIAKIHSCKFKSFQTKIQSITKLLLILLIILSIIWYLIIFISVGTSKTYDLTEKLDIEDTTEHVDTDTKIDKDYY